MATGKEYSLLEAIEAVCMQVDSDLDIVTVEIAGPAKNPIVRVYIDHPDGVGFDLLCNTQKWIGELLDKLNPFSGSYVLEVSSPGPNRPLRKPKHFEAAVGSNVKIKTSQAVDGRKSFSGMIDKVANDVVTLKLNEGKPGSEPVFNIPIEVISSAKLNDEQNW